MEVEAFKFHYEEYAKYKSRSRSILFLMYILFIFGLAASSYVFIFRTSFDEEIMNLVFFDFVIISILFMYRYLQPRPDDLLDYIREPYSKYEVNDYQEIIDAINEIEEALLICSDDNEKENIHDVKKYIERRVHDIPQMDEYVPFDVVYLKDRVKLSLFKQTLRRVKGKSKRLLEEEKNKSQNRSKEEINKDDSLEKMVKLVKFGTSRLNSEIQQLTKRGNIYIVFGSAITLVAGWMLYDTIQDLIGLDSKASESKEASNYDIYGVLLRFSIVVFVEIFAFYYLRLYKNIMDNVKYYQNEITNVEMRILALYAVESNDSKADISNLVEELSKTERNFVIDKNKTTIDIERSKADSDIFTKSIDSFSKLVSDIKK